MGREPRARTGGSSTTSSTRASTTSCATSNAVYKGNEALWSLDQDPAGFSWIDANDNTSNVFSFLRLGKDGGQVACIANFGAVPRHDYRVGLPTAGAWTGDPQHRFRRLLRLRRGQPRVSGQPQDEEWHGRPAFAVVQLPSARGRFGSRLTRQLHVNRRASLTVGSPDCSSSPPV